jgi:PHD/YefM family antitoxin component YafN of YafNO toxin-antitoxin module|nr:prevent-host-death protein [Prevotella sp.]
MQIVSTREFRANQKKYFELAERETVFVSRKNARPIVISVADDDDFLSKEELLSIQKGLEDIKNGRTYRMQDGESLTDFLKRTEECIK